MRYLICSDLHGNVLAAEAVLKAAKELAVDAVYHNGDAVSIGPWPVETLDLLRSASVHCIKGNHEEEVYLGHHPDVSIGEAESQQFLWLMDQLQDSHIEFCRTMPYTMDISEHIRLQHFAIGPDGRISTEFFDLQHEDLPARFEVQNRKLVIFGHIHRDFSRTLDSCEFRCFGTSGLVHTGGTGKKIMLLDTDSSSYSYRLLDLEWDTNLTRAEFEVRNIPGREEVLRLFF